MNIWKSLLMKLDTATDFSMSKSEYLEKFAHNPLTASKVMLKTYKVNYLLYWVKRRVE